MQFRSRKLLFPSFDAISSCCFPAFLCIVNQVWYLSRLSWIPSCTTFPKIFNLCLFYYFIEHRRNIWEFPLRVYLDGIKQQRGFQALEFIWSNNCLNWFGHAESFLPSLWISPVHNVLNPNHCSVFHVSCSQKTRSIHRHLIITVRLNAFGDVTPLCFTTTV